MANEKGRGNMRNLNETLREVLPASMFPIVMPCHCGSRVFHTIDELLGFIEVADTADHKGIKQDRRRRVGVFGLVDEVDFAILPCPTRIDAGFENCVYENSKIEKGRGCLLLSRGPSASEIDEVT